jgi:Skp family chaperone for outer membrane proteins
MSNLSSVINDNQNHLKGATFHFKAYAIIMFVLAGFMILAGVPLLLLLGLGLIYIGIGVLYIFLGRYIMNASNAIKNIIGVSELTQDDYNTNSMTAIVELKKFFKAMNIIFVVAIAFSIIASIAVVAFGAIFFKNLESQYPNPYSNPALKPTLNSKYQANPGNKTAEQMGMSQADHDTLHDPKNIQQTDYSQLDYSDQLSPEEKAQADKFTKDIIDKMNPENKALMNELMGNSSEGILNKLDK